LVTQNCEEMADETERSIQPLITADHFAEALRDARCSVSPEDVKKYKQFAKTLPQCRGIGSHAVSVSMRASHDRFTDGRGLGDSVG